MPHDKVRLIWFPSFGALLLSLVILAGCRHEVSPAWGHADIAFQSDRPSGVSRGPVYVMNDDGRRWAPVEASSFSTAGDGLSWSPTAPILAFVDWFDFEPDNHPQAGILLVVADNGQTQRVPYGPCRFFPAWAPSGDYLSFYTECDGKSALAIASPTGADEMILVEDLPPRRTSGYYYSMRITWSPDSQTLAYDRRISHDEHEIWMVNVDGTGNRRLTMGEEPAWSPTGNAIAFVREEDIWIHSLDSGEERLFLDDPVTRLWQ